MAWERRGSNTYYYRSVRRGGRVEKEYRGGGVPGMLTAELDAEVQREREDRRAVARAERERWADLERSAREVDDLMEGLTAIELLAAGFHRHDRGAWRRRRD